MARNRSLKRELIATLLSIAISIIGAVDLIGHPARMVHISQSSPAAWERVLALAARSIATVRSARRDSLRWRRLTLDLTEKARGKTFPSGRYVHKS
jgi:hypothetical protein